MHKDIDFNNHFWLKRDGKIVYSSKNNKYISIDNEIYQEWAKKDNFPTSHPRDSEDNETYEEMLVVLASLGVGRRYKLLKALDEIDSEYRTLRTIANAQIGDIAATQRLEKAEKLAKPLREELEMLENNKDI